MRSAPPVVRFNRMNRRKFVIITAPSGAGKTSIVKALRTNIDCLRFAISATTRPPRTGEVDGRDYHFLTKRRFEELIAQNRLAEYEEVYPGLYYGTLRSELEVRPDDAAVILDIDVKGALRLYERYRDECLTIFIRPPSLEELERRLRGRGTESEETLMTRLRRAIDEMEYNGMFHCVVLNKDLDEAIARAEALINDYIALST